MSNVGDFLNKMKDIFTLVVYFNIIRKVKKMKRKEDLRILKTKESLYRSLLEIMKTTVFEEVKVSDICQKSKINRSTFYDHFTDKFELLYSLINDMREELTQSLIINIETNSLKETYMEMIKALLEFIEKNKDIYSSVLKINGNSIAIDMMTNTLLESITNEINENFINDTGIPTKKIVLFYVSGVITIVKEGLMDLSTYNKEEIYYVLDKLITPINMKKREK